MNIKTEAQNKVSRTPLPWEVYEGMEDKPSLEIVYEDRTGQLVTVADCFSSDVPVSERLPNTSFIVRACNSHEELLEVLKMAATHIRPLPIESSEHGQRILAAIARAEGREE